MGMYPPGHHPIPEEKETIPILPMGEIPPEMTLQSSPNKASKGQPGTQHENFKNGNRNI